MLRIQLERLRKGYQFIKGNRDICVRKSEFWKMRVMRGCNYLKKRGCRIKNEKRKRSAKVVLDAVTILFENQCLRVD